MIANASDKPLVTISMITYNQEKYVRDAVRGLLAQTYEPLEVVISDDHSTDRTWNIINEEIDAYKTRGGIHKNIVLNRNEKNLGIAKNSELAGTFKHGEITVSCGGDDISLPNRVARIVEVWENAGRPRGWIFHGGRKITDKGYYIGDLSDYGKWRPLGAASVYVGLEDVEFPEIKDPLCYEDWIFSRRAMMIGKVLQIKDELILYRYGVGVSTSVCDFRARSCKTALSMIKTCEQIVIDVESRKNLLPSSLRDEILSCNSDIYQIYTQRYALFGGLDFSSRRMAFKNLFHFRMLCSIGNLFQCFIFLLCLLPPGRFDCFLNFVARLAYCCHCVKYFVVRFLEKKGGIREYYGSNACIDTFDSV